MTKIILIRMEFLSEASVYACELVFFAIYLALEGMNETIENWQEGNKFDLRFSNDSNL